MITVMLFSAVNLTTSEIHESLSCWVQLRRIIFLIKLSEVGRPTFNADLFEMGGYTFNLDLLRRKDPPLAWATLSAGRVSRM